VGLGGYGLWPEAYGLWPEAIESSPGAPLGSGYAALLASSSDCRALEPSAFVPVATPKLAQGGLPQMKITLAVAAAAAVLTTGPLATPAKAQGVEMAQGVDVQIGRDRDYHD
jgi:hypothetical protein